MKKWALVLGIMMLFTVAVMAQGSYGQTTTTGTHDKSHKGDMAKGNTLTGCLASGQQGMFTLTMLKKGKTKTINVQPSALDLNPHLGHEVKLTGTWEEKSAAPAGETSATGEKGLKRFTATNAEHISNTCTTTAAGETKPPK